MEEIEIWRAIPDFSGYECSSAGNFRSVARKTKSVHYKCNNGFRLLTGRPMSQSKSKFGYLHLRLTNGAQRKGFQSHRLIALTFIPNPENKPFINHKNGIKTDNRVDNLEWCTKSENQFHAYKNNLRKPVKLKGELNGSCVITEKIATEIKILCRTTRPSLVARQFGLTNGHVDSIKNGRSWKHIIVVFFLSLSVNMFAQDSLHLPIRIGRLIEQDLRELDQYKIAVHEYQIQERQFRGQIATLNEIIKTDSLQNKALRGMIGIDQEANEIEKNGLKNEVKVQKKLKNRFKLALLGAVIVLGYFVGQSL